MDSPAPHQRIFCALDTDDLGAALDLARTLRNDIGGLKIGLEFFSALGRPGLRTVSDSGLPVFLDLKLHDIPNTVARAVHTLTPLAPSMMTVHAQGGRAMLQAAVSAASEAAAEAGVERPRILGVTVLTSLDDHDLEDIGVTVPVADQVLRLAGVCRDAGIDGVVCSPREIAALRARFGPDFLLVVPGIRPGGTDMGDQKRVMTPGEALQAGASYLVIGRPITSAQDPQMAARAIANDLAQMV